VGPPDVAQGSPPAGVGQPLDADVVAAVAAEAPAMFDLLAELVESPTLLGNEMSGQDVMRRAFAGLGLTPFDVRLDTTALAAHPGASPFSWDVSGKANVLADWLPTGSADGRSLILNGHIDVVSPEPSSLWTGPPFSARRDGDWLYGRGSGDMKAGLAAIVGAVRALQRMGLAPRAKVQLQSVVEEECTGNGALASVMAGHTADAAILTEPTGAAVWTAQVGVLWFQVRVIGMPAHTGETARGANAIEATYAVIEALRGLETQLNVDRPPLFASVEHPINLNVGVIRGGDWASTVAGECVTSFRLAVYPGQPVAELASRVEATVAATGREHPLLRDLEVEVLYDGFRCEGYALAHDAPLVTELAAASARVTGEPPPLYASTATTDARSFQLYGDTPAVCFGPYAEDVHGVDERVYLPSVVSTAQTLALFIRDWCGLTTA
jgi:acetylornithine deacetylase